MKSNRNAPNGADTTAGLALLAAALVIAPATRASIASAQAPLEAPAGAAAQAPSTAPAMPLGTANPEEAGVEETQKVTLSNGAPLEVARNPAAPRDTVVVAFMGGGGKIPKDTQGVTRVLYDALSQGPEGMTHEAYRDTLFYANGSISFSTDYRATYLVLKAPPAGLGDLFSLARELMSKPKLDAKTFAESKAKVLTDARASMDSMGFVARYFSGRHLFGYHPETLNDTGSPWSLSNVTRDDALKWSKELFRWENAFYVSTGPTAAPAMAKTVEASLWPAKKPGPFKPLKYVAVAPLKGKGAKPSAVVIHKPGSTDNQVFFYFPLALKLDSPEALDASIAHEILGGGLTGDLGRVLRVERGLTYGANSFVGTRLPVWGVYTFGGLFQTQDLLTGTLEVVDGFRKRPITAAEVDLAKDGARTDYQGAFELPSDRVFERIRYRLYGLDETFLENYLGLLERVTPQRVKSFVDRKVRREGGRLYVMGDKDKIVPILKKIGLPVVATVSIDEIR